VRQNSKRTGRAASAAGGANGLGDSQYYRLEFFQGSGSFAQRGILSRASVPRAMHRAREPALGLVLRRGSPVIPSLSRAQVWSGADG